MLIKQQALAPRLNQKLAGIYVLIGQDYYLLNEAAVAIKAAWRQKNSDDYEESVFDINNAADWKSLLEEANSYSLFANHRLIDARYDKKTLDAAGKAFFNTYLQTANPRCLLLLRATQLPQKQLQWLVNNSEVHIVQANSLNDKAMQEWIINQLTIKKIKFEPQIPALIHQFTQGNMLACAQALEKIQLVHEADTLLTHHLVHEQLIDQCDFQLFELSEACLSNQPAKAIQLLRFAANNKTEPTLILWLLAQEIRLLLQLNDATRLFAPFSTACNHLKIWPAKEKLYQAAVKRSCPNNLIALLRLCKTLDERIKSNQNNQVWQCLEQIALALCLNKQVINFA